VRFQDAARDGRAVVYAGIQAEPVVARAAALLADASPAQRVLARAVMTGTSTDPAILAVSLEIADRGDQVRDQLRGAIVEALTETLLTRRVGASDVHRERRVLFDGVRAEIHPYDVTVERDGAAEAWDCKWGARGINGDVLHQLDDARGHAAEEDERLRVGLVVFDAERSCRVRIERQTAPTDGTELVSLETLDRLAKAPTDR
jgi:hypothetical protein